MDIDSLLKNIENFMDKNNKQYFSYAWREKIIEYLSEESKYARLVDWIDDQINYHKDNMNVFNPADRLGDYNNSYFKVYENACKNIAILLNFKKILLDKACTINMRENIEYAICKIYKIHYNDKLDCYM